MTHWPPAVLLGVHRDAIGQAMRDMLRACGIRELDLRYSSPEVSESVRKQSWMWDVLILDGSLAGGLQAVETIRQTMGRKLKIIVIFSGPKREDILEALRAGVNDFLAYPVSRATVEKKLRRLMDQEERARPGAAVSRSASELPSRT